MNAIGRISALGILISIKILMSDSSCSITEQHQEPWGYQQPEQSDDKQQELLPGDGNILAHVVVITEEMEILITWKITLRDQPRCTISYEVETEEISAINCTDRRITLAFTPDQSPDIHIDTVELSHEGHYSCQMASTEGHFQQIHDLQVLGEKRAAVCEAIAGKPAAQISWTPDGCYVTKTESHSNGTVTVRSTYHREHSNVSAVFCFVSHLTGNQTLSIEQNQGVTSPLHSLLIILYVKLSLLGIILLILGFAFFQKRNYFR
ncbi:cell surface glycoprotein CD200 receptor 2 [Cricetulus griseus]|uniref:Cell surface glycoprotein CD200 receptor 2 n=1 Tax=Cricetulus griseus TaxID=10029 RepID=A0A9J7H0M4_CRIGR|nr:cell surface glycoprotein CD200 receptor 2 [Cricetulus griseus]